MAESYPANIDIVYADGDQRLRHNLRAALNHNGYRGIREFSHLDGATGAIRLAAPDIFLVDGGLSNGSSFEVIENLRHHKLGKNPFLSVIVSCETPNNETVTKFINSGVDYLVVKPVAPSQLIQRFKMIAKKRKPFEVTSDYIGPDRSEFMKGDNGEAGSIIEVPNTVGMKARREMVSQGELEELVHAVMGEINVERLRQDARQIARLVMRVADLLHEGHTNGRLRADAVRILAIILDIKQRLPSTTSSHTVELCDLLAELTEKLMSDPESTEDRVLGLLAGLADAIFACIREQEDSDSFARQIVGMVRRSTL